MLGEPIDLSIAAAAPARAPAPAPVVPAPIPPAIQPQRNLPPPVQVINGDKVMQ
jgi:hypothetical protein